MYIPRSFEEDSKENKLEFIKKHQFATLISTKNEKIDISHIPLYFQTIQGKDYLLGHLAKANEHWKSIEGDAVAVFNGPHAYVSEKWYEASNVVPTWNYIVVHVKGKINLTDENDLKQIIEMMVESHEGDLSLFKKNIDDQFYSSLLKQIIGIKMEIETIEGKWKLSQNKTIEVQDKIANQLFKQEDFNAKLIAEWMKKNNKH